MQRILHLGKYYPPFAGGIEHFLADLITAQQQQGLTVAALVHDHQAKGLRFWAPVTAETEAPAVFRCPSYGRLLYAPLSPHFPFWLHRIIQRWQPDLLHLHCPNTSVFWALSLPAARRLPWVIHWHSDVTAQYDRRLQWAYHLYRPFEQAMLRKAHTVIATSTPYLASSEALRPWREKTTVIPLGIAAKRVPAPRPADLNWAHQQWSPRYPLRILTVGRLTYYKGHAQLIQAIARLPHAQLCLVGTGEQQAELSRLITQLGLTDRVQLFGFCPAEQLAALFSTCDVFCLPSLERTEAFGVVLLEAMRYQCAIVASAIPGAGVNWIIDPNQTGVLVPPNAVDALVHALHNLQQQPDYRRQLAIQAQRKFQAQFAIEPVAAAVTACYTRTRHTAG